MAASPGGPAYREACSLEPWEPEEHLPLETKGETALCPKAQRSLRPLPPPAPARAPRLPARRQKPQLEGSGTSLSHQSQPPSSQDDSPGEGLSGFPQEFPTTTPDTQNPRNAPAASMGRVHRQLALQAQPTARINFPSLPSLSSESVSQEGQEVQSDFPGPLQVAGTGSERVLL